MKKLDYNLIIFVALVCLYIAGQFLIGTYDSKTDKYIYDTPADADFLYYGAIINRVGDITGIGDTFPPENPAFAGTKLTQPFLQYYPAAILAKIFNPYNAIRILNVIYLIIFGFVLKSLFPKRYGWALILLFAASTYSTFINALGIDMISRGFTHAPFFILLTVALFSKSDKARIASIFVAALLNGYLMMMIIPFIILSYYYDRDRQSLFVLGAGILGMIIASLFVLSEAVEKPVYFVIAESFKFAPIEILKHAAPIIILAVLYRHIQSYILLGIAILFGAFIHYNPFFPVFLVYFSGAMLLAEGKPAFGESQMILSVLLIFMVVSFVYLTYQKFDPDKGSYYPRYDTKISKAVEWIQNHTESGAEFAALNADQKDMALIMQYRPIYLGPIELVAHLGLDWKPRYQGVLQLYKFGQIPMGVDYIFYGPVERKYFPGLSLNNPVVYNDTYVTIYQAEN